jgi:hypothetical protein
MAMEQINFKDFQLYVGLDSQATMECEHLHRFGSSSNLQSPPERSSRGDSSIHQKDNIIGLEPTINRTPTGKNRGFVNTKDQTLTLDTDVSDKELGTRCD